MRKALNPNAGEFNPVHPVPAAGHLAEGANNNYTPHQDRNPIGMSLPQTFMSPTMVTLSNDTPDRYVEENLEACPYTPVIQALMQCRATFYKHSEAPYCKHMEFERFLRRCFFAAHDSGGLSISVYLKDAICKPFWAHYSPSQLLLAHDVVQRVEGDTPSTATGVSGSPATPPPVDAAPEVTKLAEGMRTSSELEDEMRQRERLYRLYVSNVQPIVPHSIRKQLVLCAKRDRVASAENIEEAMTYVFDVFYFFMRGQFLPFFDESTGSSYSACVQFMVRLRERLLTPERASSFLEVALVLILLSMDHQSTTRRALETISNKSAFAQLSIQFLFCTYFPALVVAFLSGSPLQSVEELRHSFTTVNLGECVPSLRTCFDGAALVRDLFAQRQGGTPLWTVTLGELVAFAQGHLRKTNREDGDRVALEGVGFILSETSELDDTLHTKYPTTLSSLLQLADDRGHDCEKNEEDVWNNIHSEHHKHPRGAGSEDPPPDEFHRLAVRVASMTSNCGNETLYFCLVTLITMGCFSPPQLHELFSVIEDCLGQTGDTASLYQFMSSSACTALPVTAVELMQVICDVISVNRPVQFLSSINELRSLAR
uniref:Uncharacterized protein n=1 Tax=Trypanosoma congolense (strain IL3000) TaxID=1068625 RepID=G0ULA1_TRYCI|nr:conserved hypothetical protein [Trypanosoma congolense IL3000]